VGKFGGVGIVGSLGEFGRLGQQHVRIRRQRGVGFVGSVGELSGVGFERDPDGRIRALLPSPACWVNGARAMSACGRRVCDSEVAVSTPNRSGGFGEASDCTKLRRDSVPVSFRDSVNRWKFTWQICFWYTPLRSRLAGAYLSPLWRAAPPAVGRQVNNLPHKTRGH
jgi:hypothetical protein